MFSEMVLLQFWTIDRRGRRLTRAKYRKYERTIDAVKDAWQGRDAKLSERGVLTIQTSSTTWLRQRIRADGNWLRPNGWRQFKELLMGRAAFPR